MVQLAWDWQNEPNSDGLVTADGMPEFLKDAPFQVEREPPTDYDLVTWRQLVMQEGRARQLSKRMETTKDRRR